MSVLEHPTAQALLEQATLAPQQIAALAGRLDDFLRRYGPCFYRQEHRHNAALVLQGKLSGLERKTSEPIAIQAGVHCKPIRTFVGGGKWVWASTRCAVGWAGTTTGRCRCWRCGFWRSSGSDRGKKARR
jgi:hypothetical protein